MLLGEALVEYGEQNGWDEVTIQQSVLSTVDAVKYVSDFVQKQLGRGGDVATSTKDMDSSKVALVDDRLVSANWQPISNAWSDSPLTTHLA